MQLEERKTFPKCAASSWRDFSLCDCLTVNFSALKDLKSIPIAFKLRTWWIAIRRNLKQTQEASEVNISLGRCVIAEQTGCFVTAVNQR